MASDDLSPTTPALNLTQAYRNAYLSPLRVDHPWYVDLSPAREQDLKPAILSQFRRKKAADPGSDDCWERLLFVSTRGSGKTTELNKISADLRDRLEVVYIESNLELNSLDFTLPELLLVLAVKVDQHFREHVQRPLPNKVMDDLMKWFAKITREDVKSRTVEAGLQGSVSLPEYVPFFRSIQTLLKFRSESSQRIVQELKKYPQELCARLNDLLAVAHEVIRKDQPEKELLLIIDNLDRYSKEVVDEALVNGADVLKGVRANLILTPPLSLLAQPLSEPINVLYHAEFMHTPRLRCRSDAFEELTGPGYGLLTEILDKRMDRTQVMKDPESVTRRLVFLSGGSPRKLLELFQESVNRSGPNDRLELDHIERVMRTRRGIFRDQVNLNRSLLPFLARVHLHKQLASEPELKKQYASKQGYMELINLRWILKYDSEDWWDIDPEMLEIPEVKEAVEAAKSGGVDIGGKADADGPT